MRRRAVLCAFVALCLCVSANAQTMRFRFAFGALSGQKLKSITEDTTLNSGDKLRFLIELQQPGFVYLLYRGPANSIDVLFPSDLKDVPAAGRKYFVPAGNDWLELDNTKGMETFYLLGSVQRLTSLEAAIRKGVSTEIVAEIRKLRSQNTASAAAERPVVIGGNVRSVDSIPVKGSPDITPLAVDINVNGFFGRTFTIDHR